MYLFYDKAKKQPFHSNFVLEIWSCPKEYHIFKFLCQLYMGYNCLTIFTSVFKKQEGAMHLLIILLKRKQLVLVQKEEKETPVCNHSVIQGE